MSDGIEVVDQPESSRYALTVGGEMVGAAEYELSGNRMTFTHTEVDTDFQGRGLGTRLVGSALDDARSRGLVVVPACTFVAGFIDRRPAYADLLAEP